MTHHEYFFVCSFVSKMNETLIEEEVCYSVNKRFGLYERWTLSVYVLKRQQIRRQMNFEYLFKFHIPQSKLASKIATQIATQLWGLYAHCSVFNQFSLEVPLAPKCVIVWINHKSYTFLVIWSFHLLMTKWRCQLTILHWRWLYRN